jgi:phage protein D
MAGEFTVKPRIKIDGTQVVDDVSALLEQVVVDDHVDLPAMLVLRFRDVSGKVHSDAKLKIGARVELSAPSLGGGQPEKLFSGEIVALEAEYAAGGSHAIVRAFDGLHRLTRGRRSESYLNVKDSDIVRKIAQRNKLQPGTIDNTPGPYPHVYQHNQTDFEFVLHRAARIGFLVSAEDGKLNFRKMPPASGAPGKGTYNSTNPLQLVFGQDLLEFRPRVTAAEQVPGVKVRGWDPKTKQALIGSAQAGATNHALPTKPGDLASKFSAPEQVAVDTIPFTQAEADSMAQAAAQGIGGVSVEADGVARGNPKLKAGQAVSISAVADAFAGRYTLSQTRHVFDSHGYRTQFEIRGWQQRSTLGLITAGTKGAGGGAQPMVGVVMAIVTNNDDPDKLGRVKVRFPWLGDLHESDWARLATLGAGKNTGAVFIPEVTDEVLVAFEQGDIRRPYVIGGLWNGIDKPPLGSGLIDHGKVKRRGFVSRKGHKAVFFDADGNSGMALLTSDGNVRLALKESSGGEIHLYCQGKIHIQAGQGIKIEAQTQLELSGQAGVKITSSGPVEVSGTPIKLN